MDRNMVEIMDGFECSQNTAPMQYIPTIIYSKDGNRLGARLIRRLSFRLNIRGRLVEKTSKTLHILKFRTIGELNAP